MHYYNEHDKNAAAWIRELIGRKLIPDGIVDERSIVEVCPDDLKGFTQVHLFAGVAGWARALQLAGWSEDRPIWSMSCPCQPFSTAGEQKGQADERHLWPVAFELVRACRPPIVVGEQVASSLVVGSASPSRGVQNLRDRKTLLRILQELEGRSSGHLQRMRQSERTPSQTNQARGGGGWIQSMAGQETGKRLGEHGQIPGENLWHSFRTGCSGHSSADRCRQMRGHGDALRSQDTSGMERSITGSDRTESRVHSGECPSGALCAERDGELLGLAEDCGGVERDTECEEQSVGRILREVGGMPEEEAPVWLDGVSADLESEGYACGAAVLGAHSVGAPHIRQRLFWAAHLQGQRLDRGQGAAGAHGRALAEAGGGMEHSPSYGRQQWRTESVGWSPECGRVESDGGLADSSSGRRREDFAQPDQRAVPSSDGCNHTAWSDYQLVPCRDGKARRIEPGSQPLVDGLPRGVVPVGDCSVQEAQATGEARVARLKGYGNAIVPQAAAQFILAAVEAIA